MMKEVELFKRGTAQTLIPLCTARAEMHLSGPVSLIDQRPRNNAHIRRFEQLLG